MGRLIFPLAFTPSNIISDLFLLGCGLLINMFLHMNTLLISSLIGPTLNVGLHLKTLLALVLQTLPAVPPKLLKKSDNFQTQSLRNLQIKGRTPEMCRVFIDMPEKNFSKCRKKKLGLKKIVKRDPNKWHKQKNNE